MRVRRQLADGEGVASAGLFGTSSTSLLPGVGIIDLATQAGLAFVTGARVRVAGADAPDVYLDGTVVSYAGTALQVLVDRYVGTVELAAWRIVQFSPGLAGDSRFGNGQSDFHRDTPDAVGQLIQTGLLLWTGEWFLDLTEGTPYAGAILGAGKRQTAEPAMRARILARPGVLSIEDFATVIDGNGRTITFSGTVETIFGTAQLQGVL